MIARKGETLFPSSWPFNACRVINRLAEIVADNGGRVKPGTEFSIVNRSLLEAVENEKSRVDSLKLAREIYGADNETRNNAIAEHEKKLARYMLFDNTPRLVNQSTYISFVVDGFHYYFQFDDNMFFPFYGHKIPVVNGKYSRDYYSFEVDKQLFLYDSLFTCTCPETVIDAAARALYQALVNHSASEKARSERKRQRVRNVYNSGFHYEYVENREPERMETIDF